MKTTTNKLACGAIAAILTVAAVAGAAQRGASRAKPIPGEDEYRSATGYTVAAMEHCKAINRLARGVGPFNAALAREHASEVTRNITALSKHIQSYQTALGPDERSAVSIQSDSQKSWESQINRLSAQLSEQLKGGSPDRKIVADTVTDLYLATRELLNSHKAAGKTLGIRAATPPRKTIPKASTKAGSTSVDEPDDSGGGN